MKPLRSFASDNNAGIHPEIIKAIALANEGHVVGYGADPYTQTMESLRRQILKLSKARVNKLSLESVHA